MIPLEVWRLKRICDVHGIDYQEIDYSLTYRENKKHLMALAHINTEDWDSQSSRYLSESFLTYYVTCIMDGATVSKEVGDISRGFSLAAYIEGKL